MRNKWLQYGRAAGEVKLSRATEEEKLALEGFIGKEYDAGNLKFKLKDFQNALDESKYNGIEVHALLECYFQEKLQSNKEASLSRQLQKEKFWEELLTAVKNNYAGVCCDWLATMKNAKTYGYNLLIRLYEKDAAEAAAVILNAASAYAYLQKLKEQGIRLALLGAEVMGNPHYFDKNEIPGKLLLYLLAFSNAEDYPDDAAHTLILYRKSGIIPDDISSFTTAYGINFFTNGKIHKAYEYFIENGEAYVLTLANLNRVQQAVPAAQNVYIIENQMVFSQICENLKGRKASLVCTSGQLKTASLILLDLLCASGCALYYSGDFDPEGIAIADKIISHCPQRIKPWHMGVQDYYQSISHEKIDDRRLQQLNNLQCAGLHAVAKEILQNKKAGYQEKLLQVLEEDIRSITD